MHRSTGAAFIVIAALGLAAPAFAHDFCVDTSAAIQGALTASQANGEDDVIWIKSGNYPLDTDLSTGLSFGSTEAHHLEIYGGFDDISTCPPPALMTFLNFAGAGTTLDGENAVRPLQISNANGDVTIEGLRFASGSVNGNGGAVNVGAASVDISFNRFYGNHASGANGEGGAVFAVAIAGTIRFYENLLFANHGTKAGAAKLIQSAAGAAKAQYNTIVDNITDTLAEPGGLRINCITGASFIIDNNIVWGNHASGGSDLGVFCAHARNTNDLYFPLTPGSTDIGFTSDLSVGPQFASCGFLCFDFELKFSSPLVDAGTDPPSAHGFDLAGKFRYQGLHGDIGAFENEVIFADGFEAP
ncbi:MAG: choice-of-anchor Q domain-containing protein [Dokdonella sp.]